MRCPIWLALAGVSALLLTGLGVGVHAANNSPRQYYSSYAKHPRHNYHYRTYYYKPSSTYAGYKHHYVIHHPRRPKHVYFYNPYKKQFWGRCEVNTKGKPLYSMLAEKDRKANLEDIDEKAFPEPSDVPSIPDATDEVKMELPPDDLPAVGTLPEK
jgi:hypothetical protein